MNVRKMVGLASVLAALLGSAVSAETLKIGIIAPLTGAAAPWGFAAAEGTKILATKVNAEGGLDVGGKRYDVEFVAYDDQYRAAEAVAAYNRLVHEDGVGYVMIMASASTMALKELLEDDEVLGFTAAATSSALDEDTRYLFRMHSTPEDFMPGFARWLSGHIEERRMVLVNPNDETGWDSVKLGEKVFGDAGFDVVGSELFERSQKDFQPMMTKIIAMNPDVIELATTPPASAGLIVRQGRELGYKGLFVKTSGPSPRELVDAAGADATEGMINLLYADRSNEGYRAVAEEYVAAVGQEPSDLLVSFYDAASVLLRAIQNAGDVEDTAKVRDSIAEVLPMTTLQGTELRLGLEGTATGAQQILTTNYISVIRDGEPVALSTLDPLN